jgi:hypothetical protein
VTLQSPFTWTNLRSLGLVTLVTVLIWVWADAETQRGGSDLLHGDTPRNPAVEEAELTVETLPVSLGLPAGGKAMWDRVRPEATELKRVTIAGPRSVIARLKAGDATVRPSALLTLDERDLEAGAGSVSKSVELLPAGLGLRFAGPAPAVRVTIGR